MKKAAAIFTLIIFAGSAAALTASIQVEDRKASVNDPAHFVVEAENSLASQQRFRITRLNSPPVTAGWFSYPYSKTAEGGENATFNIRVFPSEYSVQQNYRFTVHLDAPKSGGETRLDEYFSVDTGTELNIFSAEIMNESYSPGDTVRMKLVLVNTAASDINDYSVSVTSLDEERTAEGEVIPSGSRREFSFQFQIPEDAEPSERQVEFAVKRDSEATVTRSFSVGKVSRIVKDSDNENKLISSTETLKAENVGNAAENVTLNLSVQSYLEPLTSFSETADRVESSGSVKRYYWKEELAPGERFQVERKTDYWPLPVALGLLVAVLATLERLYVGIKPEKTVKTVKEGVKIRIEVVNRSRHRVDEVEVRDFVPDIAAVDRDFPMAAPKVAKTGEGTRLTWDIGSLEPGEQRVMEYVVRPSVKVEGGVTFPSAEIIVEDDKLTETSKVTAEFDPANHE